MIEIKISGSSYQEVKDKAAAMFGFIAVNTTGLVITQGPYLGATPGLTPAERMALTEPPKKKPGRQPGFSPKKTASTLNDAAENGPASGQVNGAGSSPTHNQPADTAPPAGHHTTTAHAAPRPAAQAPQNPFAAPAEPAAQLEVSLEQTKAAVERVLNAKGVGFAHQCIKHFGGERIRDLDKSKWPALIQYCEAQV